MKKNRIIKLIAIFIITVVICLHPTKVYYYNISGETIQDSISLEGIKKEKDKENLYVVKLPGCNSVEVPENIYEKWVKDYNTLSIRQEKLEVVELTYRFFGRVFTRGTSYGVKKEYYPWNNTFDAEKYTIENAYELKQISFKEAPLWDSSYIRKNISFGCDEVYYGVANEESSDTMTLLARNDEK